MNLSAFNTLSGGVFEVFECELCDVPLFWYSPDAGRCIYRADIEWNGNNIVVGDKHFDRFPATGMYYRFKDPFGVTHVQGLFEAGHPPLVSAALQLYSLGAE